MVDTPEVALLMHDTLVIIDASAPAFKLFRCERDYLVGKDLFSILAYDDFKALARLRMRVLREQGNIPPVRYPFLRADNTIFWADIRTDKIAGTSEYESRFSNINSD